MTIYKQIQAKFWQDDFVLELAPEERYFYMYLITNTMTTLCGIYRFNLRLAELETGLSPESLKKYLDTFERRSKIIVSRTTKEIMIVNWLKHNFKMNKNIISSINMELKEIKDKELLRQFYEICRQRQYPAEEIFKGMILSLEAKEEAGSTAKGINEGQDIPERHMPNVGQVILRDQEQNTEQAMSQSPEDEIAQAIRETPEQDEEQSMPYNPGQETAQAIHQNLGHGIRQDVQSHHLQNTVQGSEKLVPLYKAADPLLLPADRQNMVVPQPFPLPQTSCGETKGKKTSPEVPLFKGLKAASNSRRRKKEKGHEEIEAEISVEEYGKQEVEGTPIMAWSFCHSDRNVSSISST